MAYALDEHELKAGETKESVIREFYAFLGSSPLARDNHQGGTGARGTASLPRYAILWLGDIRLGVMALTPHQVASYPLEKAAGPPGSDPERQYGSRETSSPRGPLHNAGTQV